MLHVAQPASDATRWMSFKVIDSRWTSSKVSDMGSERAGPSTADAVRQWIYTPRSSVWAGQQHLGPAQLTRQGWCQATLCVTLGLVCLFK